MGYGRAPTACSAMLHACFLPCQNASHGTLSFFFSNDNVPRLFVFGMQEQAVLWQFAMHVYCMCTKLS
jgi:hypothetical protein